MGTPHGTLGVTIPSIQNCITQAKNRIEGVDVVYIDEFFFGRLQLFKLSQHIHARGECPTGKAESPNFFQYLQIETDILSATRVHTPQAREKLRHPLSTTRYK